MKKWLAILIMASVLISAFPVNAQSSGPFGAQVTRQHAILFDETVPVGTAEYWNTRDNFMVEIILPDGWVVTEAQLYAGEEPPSLNKGGQPVPGQFTCVREFATKKQNTLISCSLEDEIGFTWGGNRTIYVALHGQMVNAGLGSKVKALNSKAFWALPVNDAGEIQSYTKWPKLKWGGYFTTVLFHPQRGHFIDSPVGGLTYRTPTNWGTTDEYGGFDYFPGERVDLWLGPVYLGNPIAKQKTSPMDIFEGADLTDVRVVNMARLLQSLDADGSPKAGINITYGVTACLSSAMMELDISEVDFNDGFQVNDIINTTIYECSGNPEVTLIAVSAEDAIANLDRSTNGNMFRKNISRTPDLISSKSKLDLMTVWFPAFKADGSPASIEYYDENGNMIRTANDAKPVVVTYTDSVPETGAEDIFAAISRDDGKSFKRMNLSRAADKSSFTLENGQPYYGDAKKPVVQVKDNNILVAWTSKFCNSGKPAYAISLEDEYLYDDPYYKEDIWGVGGPQRSVDYTEQEHPEVGEIPYSCVWAARGTVVTDAMIAQGGFWSGYSVGEIVWFKPERLTSGRRDANQIFAGGASNSGFAIVWQEDPEGLLPGSAVGPGEGWSGATTSHKTDIWYSFITMADFSKVDVNFVSGGEPLHDDPELVGRPKTLVPMSLPVRLTDNAAVNTDNMMVQLDENGYPVLDANGSYIPSDDIYSTSDVSAISYEAENLTSCVKFEGGESIVERDSSELATYHALPNALPLDHKATMNCTSCHVPYGLPPVKEAPTQKSPIPLVVVDAMAPEYLGGFTNTDCTSCHYNHIVPRDRVIPVTSGLDEVAKAAECNSKGGIWKNELEAYYPYEGYPYIASSEEDDLPGTYKYAYQVPNMCTDFYEFTNNQGELKRVCITGDGRLLDGDTGASRPNLNLQTYKKADGSYSAWAIVAYEETKGLGAGNPEHTGEGDYGDEYTPEEGKNVIYHSFDFQNPDQVSAGHIVNFPETDADGNPVYVLDELGNPVLDFMGNPQLAYENARRPRFVLQGKSGMGPSRTIMVILYKEGEEGKGRPSDIMMRRVVVPVTDKSTNNPYRFDNFLPDVQNVSTVTPTLVTESNGDPISDDPWGAVKVVRWQQSEVDLGNRSSVNPWEDARAHRGDINGDFLVVGYTYTPNWGAYRNGNDKYDFFVRRSYDGGVTWTTDPNGAGITHCDTFTDPITKEKTEVCNTYGPGQFEQARNVSQLANNKMSVIEPRIVGTPGTIKNLDGSPTGKPEDINNPNVFYLSFGTANNIPTEFDDDEGEYATPLDLFYSFTTDKGESYVEVAWDVNPGSLGNYAGETVYRWDSLAIGDYQQGEAQLRMTPDGSRFYATWLEEGPGNSDIQFRRIMSSLFPNNVAP